MSSFPSIGDYALIGDCGSAALVSRDGSVDWLCWPRFDSPSVFAALLDPLDGGRFQIRPAGDYEVSRRYLDGTAILETTFTTEYGVLRLADCMPVAEQKNYDAELWPEHQLLRCLEGLEGAVEVEVTCDLRPDYSRDQPRPRRRGALGFCFSRGAESFILRGELPLHRDGTIVRGRATVQAGERRYVSLSYDRQEPAVVPALGEYADHVFERTQDYWMRWSGQCEYDGPYVEAVTRSIITLKLMTFAASGAVVAAPTTSLPEVIGGVRNWDYRFCWLRDAAFTLRVLFELGYYDEEDAFFEWLMQATRTTLPRLNVLYDVYGGQPKPEQKLRHLAGYRCSRPVRIGNSAMSQFQLDEYGEIVSAAAAYIERGRELTRRQRRLLKKLGEAIAELWDEPDNGLWEIRADRAHHTYSMAMCCVGLRQLVQLHEDGHIDVPADRYHALCDQITEVLDERAFRDDLDSFVRELDSEHVDASLLLLALNDFVAPDHPRMIATWQRIDERLSPADGLLYRYDIDDSMPGREGAFGIASFWAVAYLARAGRVDEARERFEGLLGYANDVGLYAEEIDPDTGEALGNFPQAFTHVGLINAAVQLSQAE